MFLFIAVWFLVNASSEPDYPRPVFGLNISIGPNSEISTYVCYIYNGRGYSKRSKYDITSYGKVLTGKWPSLYNPNREDLLKKHNIPYTWERDEYLKKDYFICPSFDSLWKIRFSTYPFKGKSAFGWAREYHKPSKNQLKYLNERYGIEQIDSDFFLDTNFFMLLRDVIDPVWIDQYRSIP